MGAVEQRGGRGSDLVTDSNEPRLAPRRLGFAVKVLGGGGMKDHDSRRWASGPHLRVSLGYLDAIFDYLAANAIRMYRISSNIVPYGTHPELPQFHNQIDECRDGLARLGEKARRLDLRLSLHPAQYIVLNSPDDGVAAAAVREFVSHAALLDAMGMPSDAKIVTHTGGVYGDRAGARERFMCRYEALPEPVRRRLVLENDEVSWPVADTLRIHEATGIPLVFDNLHHDVLNPEELDPQTALRECLVTWQPGETPKIHFSSQRQAERVVSRRNRATGERASVTVGAKAGQHDDWIDPDEFVALVTGAEPLVFDVMLEAKQKDLALLRLRADLEAWGQSCLAW
jgi:UV DNA damage endonuclease